MNVLIKFDSREAIPVRAIPLLTDWTRMSPDQIVAALAWDLIHLWQFKGLTAFTFEEGHMRSIPNTWWKSFPRRELKALQDRIASTQISDETGYQDWRQKSLLALPAGTFVWRDDYEPMYYNSVAQPSRGFHLNNCDEIPDLGLLPYVKLQFDPFIPDAETQRIVMDGFQAPSSGALCPLPMSIDLSPRNESKEERQDRRLKQCVDAGLTMDKKALSRLPDGVSLVAEAEGVTRQTFSEDIKAALKRKIELNRAGGTVHLT